MMLWSNAECITTEVPDDNGVKNSYHYIEQAVISSFIRYYSDPGINKSTVLQVPKSVIATCSCVEHITPGAI